MDPTFVDLEFIPNFFQMSGSSALIKSSIAKKYWMAVTGLFLCTFLIAHLAGNLTLLAGESARLGFNEYTEFMTSFILIKIASYITYFGILFHAVDGLMLTLKNRKARPVKYAHEKASANSIWASRNMGVLGTAILAFIVLHMGNFWFKYKFTVLPKDSEGRFDMYGVVVESFKAEWYVAIYVICMAALGFHLYHGFSSAFQTMGLNHPKYTPTIKKVGYGFSIVISLGFAIIPVVVYLANL